MPLSVNNKTICFVTQTIGFGGTEVHTLGLMKTLAAKGYDIELISCGHQYYDDHIDPAIKDKIKFIPADLSVDDASNSSIRRWKLLLKTIKSDIMIFPRGCNDLGAMKFFMVCKQRFKKVFVIEHGKVSEMPLKTSKVWIGGIKGMGLWWHKVRLSKRARSIFIDKIVAVSNKLAERLIKDCFYPPKKIVVIRNGVAWQEFTRDDDQGNKFRAGQDIPQDAFVFGMVTRLSQEKGADIAVQAFSLLLKRELKQPACLVIAGEGEEENRVKKLALELGIGKNVRFLGFTKNIRQVLSGFDVILLPSRSEGLPLGLLEGMAAGCLPIVSRVGGMPEVVNDPGIGMVVEAEDSKGFSEAMFQALQLPRQDIMKKRNMIINRIKDNYDLAKSHQSLLEALEIE
ncbi:MAG: glycosyltransferase family 4 protein [bacterium]|nr:glycosyltransferase family 4 protein [bacterium]